MKMLTFRGQGFAKLLFALLITFLLVACSSGGDSTPPAPVTISGTVTAPGGAIASLERKTFLAKVMDVVLPGANAMITGTAPVPSATVELIKVDNNGNQVGGVLASTTTDASGNYSIETTETLSSKLVLIVAGSGGAELRAIVVNANTDIDPVSEFVVAQIESSLTNSGASLVNLTNADIENYLSSIDSLNVDLTGMTVSAAMMALSNADGGSLASDVATDVVDTTGGNNTAFNLSGTWSYVETSGPNNCGDPVGVILASETVDITQAGNSITVRFQGQVIATGTLSGNQITGFPLETYPEDGGTTTETSQTFTVAMDGNTINASISWVWSGGEFSCSGTDTAVITRN